ncbi:hypothetical protein, partial [Paenibacillus sp. HB172176]|uniref:hypothetical protein n=1 Tax=Paenibacillus sp. HB172176 TaxID=2493690 RepID=UPI00143ADC11
SVDLTGKMKASNVQVTGGTMQIGSKFGVASDGTLTANNANISGNINMNGGSINWGSVPKASYSAGEVGALSTGSPMLTNISPYGIYTGTLDANQINAGKITSQYIDAKNLSAEKLYTYQADPNVTNGYLTLSKGSTQSFGDLELWFGSNRWFTIYNNVGSASLRSNNTNFLSSSGSSTTAHGSWSFTGSVSGVTATFG